MASRVASHVKPDNALLLMEDANTRTGEEDPGRALRSDKAQRVFSPEELNRNGDILQLFAEKHRLALLNAFVQAHEHRVWHTCEGHLRNDRPPQTLRIDCMFVGQEDKRIERNSRIHACSVSASASPSPIPTKTSGQ